MKRNSSSVSVNLKKPGREFIGKITQPPNWYTINFVSGCYEKLSLSKNFKLDSITEDCLLKLFKNVEVTKAAGIKQVSGKFLKDGVWISEKPISELCNRSMILEGFPDTCKMAKVKPIFKKGLKSDPSNYSSISLLLLLSEVFEKVALDQAKEFLILNKTAYQPLNNKEQQQLITSIKRALKVTAYVLSPILY